MKEPQPAPLTLAALDLGSNSFHMLIGRVVDREVRTVDRVREQVALGSGLDENNCLTAEVMDRALESLERMGQRLRALPRHCVRVVGTNTLRRARNARSFRQRAEKVLGHPIEVVSGTEEARLIYLGAVTGRFTSAPQLVADIGGGSTEIILGEGFEVVRSSSLYMGCLGYTQKFFPGGELSKEGFRQAEIAARLELEPSQQDLRETTWETAVGTSGTIHAVHEVLRVNGWSEGITAEGLKRLRKAMIEAGRVENLQLEGLKPDRAPILAGGLAILRSIFRSLDVTQMEISPGALREGVLHDLLGRIAHEDIRDRTIAHMVDRYRVDMAQARRVERTARRLLEDVAGRAGKGDFDHQFLAWGSRLHETGLAISHTGFHKHGAYLVANSDMPGFSADDQATLAALIRAQRRRIVPEIFDEVPADRLERTRRLAILFRLAVLLNRGRAPQTQPRLQADEEWRTLSLVFPAGWARRHPLTVMDLEREAEYLKALETTLQVSESPVPAAAAGGT